MTQLVQDPSEWLDPHEPKDRNRSSIHVVYCLSLEGQREALREAAQPGVLHVARTQRFQHMYLQAQEPWISWATFDTEGFGTVIVPPGRKMEGGIVRLAGHRLRTYAPPAPEKATAYSVVGELPVELVPVSFDAPQTFDSLRAEIEWIEGVEDAERAAAEEQLEAQRARVAEANETARVANLEAARAWLLSLSGDELGLLFVRLLRDQLDGDLDPGPYRATDRSPKVFHIAQNEVTQHRKKREGDEAKAKLEADKAKLEANKATWIADHGSPRLKKSVQHGIEHTKLYVSERLYRGAGWASWSQFGTPQAQGVASSSFSENPTLEGLELLEEAMASGVKLDATNFRLMSVRVAGTNGGPWEGYLVRAAVDWHNEAIYYYGAQRVPRWSSTWIG